VALAVAAELGSELRDGAAFVDLSALHDPSLVGTTIAESLGVHEGGRPVLEALLDHLRPRSLLLVLDNFEQLLPAAPAIGELLAGAPRLLVLATSRAPLHLRAEHEYPVPPFELPDPAAPFERLTASDAVRLFAQHARAVDSAFELTEESARAVAAICAKVDGLPLAIELAAGRTRLLPPVALATRLGRALDLLTEGPRDLGPRQQTMRATLDWSYRTLEGEEQRILGRLAVFAGAASLSAAEVVCDASLDSLGRLVDVSLVRRVTGLAGEPRFAMLDTIREYALDRLEQSGEADEYRRRHCSHFLDVAEDVARSLQESVEEGVFERLEIDHDNLRAALDWASDVGDVELETRLAIALSHFWRVRGHLSEGRAYFERVLAHVEDADPRTRADALVHGATFPYRQGDIDPARTWWEESLALYRSLDDVEGATRSQAELGTVAVSEGDLARARELFEDATEGFERLGQRVRLGIATANLAAVANMQRDLEASARYGAAAAALQEEIGDRDSLAITLHNLSRTTFTLGDARGAYDQLARALRVAR
jgi:predicted ATPase